MKKILLSLVVALFLIPILTINVHAVTCSDDIYNVDLGFPLEGNPSDYEIFLPFGVAWCNDDGVNWGGSTTRHLGADLKIAAEDSTNSSDGSGPEFTHGKEVKAAYAGHACKYNAGTGWGMGIYIRHEVNGYVFYTIYTHVDTINSSIPLNSSGPCTAADGGHPVGKGDVIAQVLDLNNSNVGDRDHLHYAIRCDDIGPNMKCGGGTFDSYGNLNCKNPLPFFTAVPEDKRPNIDKYFRSACQTYPDVAIGRWYYEHVEKLTWRGVVQGYETGSFGYDQPVVRVEFLKMAVEAFGSHCCDDCANFDGCTSCGAGPLPYPDVDSEAWYYRYVRAAHFGGWISSEYGDFNPGDPATRPWVAEVLVRARGDQGKPCDGLTHYNDIPEGDQCDPENVFPWIAAEIGIFTGYTDMNCQGVVDSGHFFCPDGQFNRAQAATVINKAISLEATYE